MLPISAFTIKRLESLGIWMFLSSKVHKQQWDESTSHLTMSLIGIIPSF